LALTKNVVQEEIAADVMERALANGSVDQTKINVTTGRIIAVRLGVKLLARILC